jgi:hypothetical protein
MVYGRGFRVPPSSCAEAGRRPARNVWTEPKPAVTVERATWPESPPPDHSTPTRLAVERHSATTSAHRRSRLQINGLGRCADDLRRCRSRRSTRSRTDLRDLRPSRQGPGDDEGHDTGEHDDGDRPHVAQHQDGQHDAAEGQPQSGCGIWAGTTGPGHAASGRSEPLPRRESALRRRKGRARQGPWSRVRRPAPTMGRNAGHRPRPTPRRGRAPPRAASCEPRRST